MSIATIRPVLVLPVGLALAALTSGCTYLKQAREDVTPAAVPAMHAAQTLNPDAGKNRKVVAGQDGRAAAKVSESYAKSFERSSQQKAAESFQGTAGLGTN
jgi:hypothetical protein